MGTNGAYYRDYRGDDFDGHHDKRFAEDDGREEGIFKRRDDGELPNPRICQTYGHWQDNHNHDPDEFHYASVQKY